MSFKCGLITVELVPMGAQISHQHTDLFTGPHGPAENQRGSTELALVLHCTGGENTGTVVYWYTSLLVQ